MSAMLAARCTDRTKHELLMAHAPRVQDPAHLCAAQ